MMATLAVPPSKYNPEAICTVCNKPYAEHKTDPDENGWAVVGMQPVVYPDDYPVYQGRGVWSNM